MNDGLFDLVEETSRVDTQSFEALEAKINQVLDRLKDLQAEKLELARKLDILQGRFDEASQQVDELTREREMLKRNQRDTAQEELIRSKIAALLTKLETA
jgi:FtsZ-binding cell division protein ZapB